MVKEEPEKIIEVLDDILYWESKEDIVKDLTEKLKELGYSLRYDINPNIINIECDHGKVCRSISLTEISDRHWIFEIDDKNFEKDKCQICRRKKIIEYEFDEDKLIFWDKYNRDDEDEIDLNELIDWDEVYSKALVILKDKFPKGTTFFDIEKDDIYLEDIDRNE